MKKWIVPGEFNGRKLVVFLYEQLDHVYSMRQLKRALENGFCTVNGKIERFASKAISRGQMIVLKDDFDKEKQTNFRGFEKSRIIFEDAHLFAYDKPAKIDVNALNTVLQKHCKLFLVHRLDKETSGVLIFAKDKEVLKLMRNLFSSGKVKKTYFAIVDGYPKKDSGVIENYLGKINYYHGQTIWGIVGEDIGKFAKTKWECIKRNKKSSLIKCQPETGRTHQIRVHLASIGHPILGDYQYSKKFHCEKKSLRVMLHASEYNFPHPITNKSINLFSKRPEDFRF